METKLITQQEADLLRLKFQMEIIRTVCPIIAVALQIIVLIKLY